MGNVLRVVKRDILRLFKAPAALVVVCFLTILPSLYTWFNVAGFWNPYDNTGNMRVCVVNQDEGAYTDLTGQLDLGGQIVETLQNNDQLGWEFTDYDSAMEEVQSGRAYAAFVIPEDFSYDVTTLLSGDFEQPTLQYYVNEKAGAVSPKVTDAGANTLEETINANFVSTVSGIVAERLNDALAESENAIDASKTSVAHQLGEVQTTLGEVRETVGNLNGAVGGASGKASEAAQKLQDTKSLVEALSTDLGEASSLLTETQNALSPLASTADETLSKAATLASSLANKTNTAISQVNTAILGSADAASQAKQSASTLIEANEAAIKTLQDMADRLPSGTTKQQIEATIDSLEAQNETLQPIVSDLDVLYTELTQASSDLDTASTEVNDAIQGSIEAGDSFRATLRNETLPTLNEGTTKLSAALSSLSTAVSTQLVLIDQTTLALDQLGDACVQAEDALGQTDSLLATFEDDLATVQADVLALGTSGVLADLFGEDGIDPEKIADFMFSPTELTDEVLYPVNAYGAAMAPLFMNMTLWIGVFMLLVILRHEVDDEGISNLTAQQSYAARWLFMAPLAAMQAIVCCTGNLVLGVQPASTPLFYLTAVAASLTYLSIQYALAVLLQHIGMGLCVVLIFVQIPGATGLYPIEMTTDFFRAVYPVFPFTYGINALRETIAGFYANDWAFFVGILGVFFVAFLFIGIKLRPMFTNVNRMFSKQIKASGILNGEEVELPARRYRLEQLLILMADRKEFRDAIGGRMDKLLRWYPRLHRHFPLVGFLGLVLCTAVLSLFAIDKVIILTVWLAWLVFMLVFMVVVEYIRDRLEHEVSLGKLTNEELQQIYFTREGAVAAMPTPGLFRRAFGRRGAHAVGGGETGAHAASGEEGAATAKTAREAGAHAASGEEGAAAATEVGEDAASAASARQQASSSGGDDA